MLWILGNRDMLWILVNRPILKWPLLEMCFKRILLFLCSNSSIRTCLYKKRKKIIKSFKSTTKAIKIFLF